MRRAACNRSTPRSRDCVAVSGIIRRRHKAGRGRQDHPAPARHPTPPRSPPGPIRGRCRGPRPSPAKAAPAHGSGPMPTISPPPPVGVIAFQCRHAIPDGWPDRPPQGRPDPSRTPPAIQPRRARHRRRLRLRAVGTDADDIAASPGRGHRLFSAGTRCRMAGQTGPRNTDRTTPDAAPPLTIPAPHRIVPPTRRQESRRRGDRRQP